MSFFGIALAVIIVLIILKTGSIGKGIGFFFSTIFANIGFVLIGLLIGAVVAGKGGAAIGGIVGIILSYVRLFKKGKKEIDNADQNK